MDDNKSKTPVADAIIAQRQEQLSIARKKMSMAYAHASHARAQMQLADGHLFNTRFGPINVAEAKNNTLTAIEALEGALQNLRSAAQVLEGPREETEDV